MTKPTITKRAVKGAALTYDELDANFQNLKDATLTITAGSGGTAVTADLNGTITLVAGSNITLSGDNSAKTITITSSGGGSGSGTVLTGTQYNFAYYPSTGTTVDDTAILYTDATNRVILGANLLTNGFTINPSASGNMNMGDDINFPDGYGLLAVGSGTLRLRGGTVKLEYSNNGGIEFSGTQTGSPSSTTTPTGYLKVIINGSTRWIPYYT
jgi:hypothetical protein